MRIEIIGAIDDFPHYTPLQISQLLKEEQTELSYGDAFMGRPGTLLHVGQHDVIKLRSELDLNEQKTRDFLSHNLQQERKLAVHHPHKTWFLVELENHKFKIGNICPRLTPLHTLKNTESADIHKKINYLKRLYRSYFKVASHFNLRLDEGLSNFAIDHNETLYYLDDDIYSWDNFLSFSHLLGVLIRNNHWLDENHAQELGEALQQYISEFFEDSHSGYRVARLLRDIFIPDNNKKQVLSVIITQLEQSKTIVKKLTANTNNSSNNSDNYLAILSDIHANLPALEAVLDYLQQNNITQGIVLGDIVGYGPNPSECIARLQQTELMVIKGNHDHAVVSGDTKRGMSSTARWCIEWTIPRLSNNEKQWLADLALELTSSDNALKNWRAIHGSPIDPNYFYAYVYQMTYEQNLDAMEKQKMDLCFHGHSHVQGMYVRNKQRQDKFLNPKDKTSLANYNHALICSGAVGQPRDGSTSAQFAIYHQRNHQIQFMNIDYDMSKTLADLEQYAFPKVLGERLQRGE